MAGKKKEKKKLSLNVNVEIVKAARSNIVWINNGSRNIV